jgi:hypothetical protein
MRWPRKTIDAAMLAAAIRVQRNIERNIGRLVAREDGFGRFRGDNGARWKQFSFGVIRIGRPAVVERFARLQLVPSLHV